MPFIALNVFLAVLAMTLAPATPAAALETVATFAADCTTPKTVFQLGDTVCAKVSSVAGGDLNNIWLQWVAPSGAVVAGSPSGGGNTVVTTDPQTFTFALPTSGAGAEQGLWKTQTANVSNSAARVAANFRVPRTSVIGIRRDSNVTSYMRNSNTTGFADGQVTFGQAGDIGLWGDWLGNGRYTAGVYRPSDGTFHIALSNSAPAEDTVFQITGVTGGKPLVGDWNGDGTTDVGVYVGNTIFLRNSLSAGPPDSTFDYGIPGDQIFAGDWDGDGIWTPGVYRDGIFFLRNSNTTGDGEIFFAYGLSSDTAVVGNWTATDGITKPGVFRPSEATFYLRNSLNTGNADIVATFGIVSDVPNLTVHNEAPVVTAGGALSYTENQAATEIDPALTVTDMDNATLVGATATITGNCASGEDVLSFANQNGISGVYTAATCLMTLTGQSSLGNYQTALRDVKYNNTSDTPSTLARTVTWQVSDGSAASNLSTVVTSTITVGAASDAPVLTAGATIGYTEGDPATVIDNTVTVNDPDSANLASATVKISANFQSGSDVLACPAGCNGLASGFATDTLTLTGPGTLAQFQTALRTVTFQNTSNNPTATGATRTITWVGNDGSLSSSPVTSTINITAVNGAPVVTAGGTLNYTENQAAAVIDNTITVTDDSANLTSATATITGNCTSPEDVLGFVNAFGVTNGGYVSGTCTLTLNGPASPANFQSALRAVTYNNTSDNPATTVRTVTWIATDTGALSNVGVTSTINVTAVNDAPAMTAGGTLNYTENQAATVVDGGVTVTDIDSANIASATVQITTNCASPQDVLGFTNAFGVTNGGYVSGTCKLTLNGPASPANFQLALRAVTYNNTSDNPSTAARTVTWQANDGAGVNNLSNTPTSTINVTAVNDAPVLTAGATLNYTENQAAAVIDNTITVNDVDSANISSATATITGNCTPAEDVLSFVNQSGVTNGGYTAATCALVLNGPTTLANFQAALRQVKYNNTSENPITTARTVTWQVNDGGGVNNLSNTPTSTINVTAVNDLPVAQNKTGSDVVNGNAVQANMKRVGVNANLLVGATDADNGVNGCTVTFSVASITNGTSGTVSNVNLGAGTFDYEPAPGFTGPATVNYTISDNADNVADGCPPSAGNTPGISGPATVTFSVVGPVIWFVNATAGSDANTGALSSPFQSLTPVPAVDASTHRIFLYNTGTYTVGINLNSNEWLIGQGVTGASFDSYFGITPTADTIARPAINSTNSNVNASVGYASSDKIDGIDMDGGSANLTGSSATSFIVNVGRFRRTGTSANTAINLGGAGNTGTFDFKSVSITGVSGLSTTKGVSISNLTGHFTVAGTDTALTPDGGAVSGYGGNGMEFISVANGGSTSISLKNMSVTGNAQTQAVAGSASTCGGDLATGNNLSCRANIFLQSTTNVSLDTLTVTGSGQQGINGNSVNGLTIANSTINSNGNEGFENGVLLQNASGTVAVTGTSVRDNRARQLHIGNLLGTMTFNTSTSQYGHAAGGTGTTDSQQGILLQLQGTSNSTINATTLTFTNNEGAGFTTNAFQLNADNGDPTVNGSISASTFSKHAAAVLVNAAGTADVTFDVLNNTSMTNTELQAVNYTILGGGAGITAKITGSISGNTITGCSPAGSTCHGIDLNAGTNHNGELHLKIDNNTITQTGGGIVQLTDGAADPPSTAKVHLKITNNDINTPGNINGRAAIELQGALTSLTGENITFCTDVGGAGVQNVISGQWAQSSSQSGIFIRHRFSAANSWVLPGYVGPNNNPAGQVEAYLNGRNTNTATPILSTATTTTGAFVTGACVTP